MKSPLRDGARDRREELVFINGLLQENALLILRETCDALSPCGLITRDEDDRQLRLSFRNPTLECPAVHPRHADIANQAGDGLECIALEKRSRGREKTHRVTCRFEQVLDRFQDFVVVVDDADRCPR